MAHYQGPDVSRSQAKFLWANGMSFARKWEPKGLYKTLPDYAESGKKGTAAHAAAHKTNQGTAKTTGFSHSKKTGAANRMINNSRKSSRKPR